MNAHITRTLAAAALTGLTLGSAWLGTAAAHAAPPNVDAYAYENIINLSEIADEIDAIPACYLEDGSDVIGVTPGVGRCIWNGGNGNVWLTYADRSYAIVDDTVTEGVPALDTASFWLTPWWLDTLR